MVVGFSGWNPAGVVVAFWRRALANVAGLFLVYCGSMYYLPWNRRKRVELDRHLDETERELDASEKPQKRG
jgi:hypothetical protein